MNKAEHLRLITAPTVSELLALSYHGINFQRIHSKAAKAQQEMGLKWYKDGSMVLAVLGHVTRKSMPVTALPLMTNVTRFMLETDDYFDNNADFPSWNDWQEKTAVIRTTISANIDDLILQGNKAQYLKNKINSLETEAYSGLAIKNSWIEEPSFEEAYSYRVKTSGLFSIGVADLWCCITDTPHEKCELARRVLFNIGMIVQYIDDLTDINEDTTFDGNLALAILNKYPEDMTAVKNVIELNSETTRTFDLLKYQSPSALNDLLAKLNKQIVSIESVCTSLGKAHRAIVKLVLPRIVLRKGTFLEKLQLR